MKFLALALAATLGTSNTGMLGSARPGVAVVANSDKGRGMFGNSKPGRKPRRRGGCTRNHFTMHGHKMRYHFDPSPSLTNRAYRRATQPASKNGK